MPVPTAIPFNRSTAEIITPFFPVFSSKESRFGLVPAPEMGHQGNTKDKIEAIESLDAKVVAVVKREMDASGEPYRMLVLPDHPTPIRLRTHTAGPVPYFLHSLCAAFRLPPAH